MEEGVDIFKSFCGLSDEQYTAVDALVQEKILIAFENLKHDASVAQASLEEEQNLSRCLTDKHSKEIEKLSAEYNSIKDKVALYEKNLEDVDIKYKRALDEKGQMREKLNDVLSVNAEIEISIKNLKNDNDILTEQLKHKIESINELSEEVKSYKSERESVRKMKMEALCKMEEVTSLEAQLKAQDLRWENESSSIRRHNEWLEQRLKQTTDQLQTIRKDMMQKVYTLETEVDLKINELSNSAKTIQSLESCVEKLKKANEDYINKLKQVAEEQIRLEQLYGNELDAQKQLVTLYKTQSNETEDKNEQLMKATESMQSLLKEAYENVSRLESDNENMRQLFSEEQAKSKETMERLSSELQQSRDLLDKFRVDGLSEEQLRQLNPAVTATLSALKRGHSLTQLYSDYLQVVEDRDQLKLDKYRLTEYVKQLVDDVKEKVPVLRDQKEQFERLQAQVKELSIQLKASENKLGETQCKQQEMQRRAGYYQRETSRLKLTCGDLSKQVQHLLREMEILRGTVIDDTSDMNTSQSTSTFQLPDSSTLTAGDLSQLVDSLAPSSASSVIDEHLVTWSNLRDLQCQNQRLLCVARDLAGQLEKHERAETETENRVEELSTRLESLSGELEVVRLVTKEARNEAQLARRQRDAYRAILERYDIDVAESKESVLDISAEEFPASSSKGDGRANVSSSITAAAMSTATIERLEESLKSLETEFKRYRDDKVESDAIYSTTVDNLRKEASEARLLNQKLAAQLDFTHEKLRTMEANVSGYKQEITILREMNARYSTSAATSEAEIIRLHEELTRISDKLLTVEVDSRHAIRQLEVARANESRWRQEIEALRKQEQMHSRLMHQLEAIQGNLEQRDSFDRSDNERRIRQLETQLAEAQAAFVEASQAGKTTRTTLEHELAVMAEKIQLSDTEIEELQRKLAAAEETLKSIRSKTASGDEIAPVGPSSSRSAADPEQTPSLDMASERADELRQAQHEVDNLRSRLASAKQQAEQMKELAEAAENRVLEAVQDNQQAEERMSVQLDELQQRCGFLEAQLDLEKKERQNLVNENIRIAEEAHQMNAKLRRELATVESELVETKTRCEAALQLEAGAKGEIEAHGRIAQEARDKYERELALHAEDVEALTIARNSLESVNTEFREVKEALRTAQAQAVNAKTQLERETSSWETTKDELNDRLLQTDKNQTSLQEQIIKLTQQLVSLRKVMEASNKSPGTSSTSTDGVSADGDDLKTSEDLLQLVNYIRRQKSIAEAACDAQSAEVSRLLLRVSSLETEVSRLTDQLEAERKTNEMATESASRHSQLMESVQQLNLVTESNCLLRHERETLRSNCQHLEEQLRSLEDCVEPLRQETEQLKGTVSMLTLERQSLEEERNRWKERCNRLVETAQRLDPEQYRSVCNERDDLQRHLRKVEEDFQQQVMKNSELEQTMKSRDEEVNTARKALTDAQKASSEFSARCDSLRRELETKDTFVVKLREIGRKYRQEADNLRRQAQASRSDEAQLQSVSEALTEAKTDVVTLRDELAIVRSEFTRLEITVNECLQMVDEFRSEEAVEASPTSHPLISALRSIVAAHNSLRRKADSQHERLLRMQLIESQLTKSLRDCSELRQRLTEMQSASTASANSPTHTVTVCQSSSYPVKAVFTGASGFPPTTATSEAGEVVDLSTCQRLLESDSSNSSSGTTAAVVVPVQQQQLNTSDQCPAAATPAGTSQPVPAWILRAASSAIQSVPPTPAVTPPMACSAAATTACNSVGVVCGQTSSVKQMAEIKPITSNVATVMPTLILSQPAIVAFTTSAVSPSGSTSLVSVPPVTTTTAAASATPGSAGGSTSPSLGGTSFGELNYLAATAIRSVHNFRQTSAESVASQSLPMFPSISTMNVTGKRRLEETVMPVAAVESGSQGQIMPVAHFPGTTVAGVSEPKRLCQQQQRQQAPMGSSSFLAPSIGTGLFGSPADSQNSPVAASALIGFMPTALETLQPANEEGQSSAFFSPVPSSSRDLIPPASGTTSTAYSSTATDDSRFSSPQHRPPVEATLRQPSTSYSPSTFAQNESLATTPESSSHYGKADGTGDELSIQLSPVQQEHGFGDCLDPVEELPVDEGSSCSDLDEEVATKGYVEGEEENEEEEDAEEEEEEVMVDEEEEEEGEEGDEDIGDGSFIEEGVGEDDEEGEVDVGGCEGTADDVIELSSDSGDSEDDEEPGLSYSAPEAEGEEDSECVSETAVEPEDEQNLPPQEDENEDFTNVEEQLEDVDEDDADDDDDDDDVQRLQQRQAEAEGDVFEGEDEGDTADTDLIAEYVETGPEESIEQPMCSDQEADIKSEHQVDEGEQEGEMAFSKTRPPEQPAHSATTTTADAVSSGGSRLFSFQPATKSETFGGLFGSSLKPSASPAGLFALQPPTGTPSTTGFFQSTFFSPPSASSSTAADTTTTSAAGTATGTLVEMDQQPTATQSTASFRSSILKPASSATPTGSASGIVIQSEPVRTSGSLLGDPVRPKIQPIVWDETASKSGLEVGQACSSLQVVVPLMGKTRPSPGPISLCRRKKWCPSGGLLAGRSSGISRPTRASTLPAARHDPFGGSDGGAVGGGGGVGTIAGPSTSMRPRGSHPRRL